MTFFDNLRNIILSDDINLLDKVIINAIKKEYTDGSIDGGGEGKDKRDIDDIYSDIDGSITSTTSNQSDKEEIISKLLKD